MHSSLIQSFALMGIAFIPFATAFNYRFYAGEDSPCTHDGSGFGDPALSVGPSSGAVDDACRNSELGLNWDHLEIDALVGGGGSGDIILTYCNNNCQGGVSGAQSLTHCFNAPSGCAIGSFRAVPGN